MSEANNRSEVEAAVRKFHDLAVDAERVIDAVNSVFSMAPESDLNNVMWGMVGAYKDALGRLYAIDGWLEWWWLECGLGTHPMEAAVQSQELRLISTIDDLVTLICDDVAPAKETIHD